MRISDWSSDVCSSDLPDHPLVERVVVSDGFDAADDWIADAADARSIVITADILLADRALKAGATVLAPTGKPFTMAPIGPALATRAIMRSAERRVGTACVRKCRSRWSTSHQKKKQQQHKKNI